MGGQAVAIGEGIAVVGAPGRVACDVSCTGTATVFGAVHVFRMTGSEFTLRASPLPDQPGLFFFGEDSVQLPFGDGFRCVAGNVVRLAPQTATGGVLEQALDLAALGLSAGSERRFQAWFRDPAAGNAGFSLSDALRVVVGP